MNRAVGSTQAVVRGDPGPARDRGVVAVALGDDGDFLFAEPARRVLEAEDPVLEPLLFGARAEGVKGQQGGVSHPSAVLIPGADADGAGRLLTGFEEGQAPAGLARGAVRGPEGDRAETRGFDQARTAGPHSPSRRRDSAGP